MTDVWYTRTAGSVTILDIDPKELALMSANFAGDTSDGHDLHGQT
jgi:hypothetical protein